MRFAVQTMTDAGKWSTMATFLTIKFARLFLKPIQNADAVQEFRDKFRIVDILTGLTVDA